MKKRLFILLCDSLAVTLLVVFSVSCRTSEVPGRKVVRISAGLPEEEIRRQMLRYTPVGMEDSEVMNFARTRLRHGSVGPAYTAPNLLVVLLGTYGLRLVGSNDTWVQWRFDDDHRLINVEVSKSSDTL